MTIDEIRKRWTVNDRIEMGDIAFLLSRVEEIETANEIMAAGREKWVAEHKRLRLALGAAEAESSRLRAALERIGNAPDAECYEAGGIARAALSALRPARQDTKEKP